MTATYSSALAASITAAADDTARANALATALGNTRTVRIFLDPAGGTDPATSGIEVYSIGAAGAMTIAGGKITGHGTLSGTTVRAAANLATGSACLRIEGNGAWAQFSLGLSGTKDLIASSSLVANGGITLKNLALRITPGNSGGAGGGGTTPPYTGTMPVMTVLNEDSASAASGFIAPMFGHPFKKGHIPAGSYPEFKTAAGATCPYTMFNKTTWPDGSLKFASFLMRVPAAVAAGASVTVSVAATTTAPGGTSARTLADLSSGSTDLNVAVVGLDQLAGTWVSSLNQGVTDNDDVLVLGDGPVGKVWRIRQQFMQAGANHGQLECYWYVAALQDAAGGLYGIRHLARITQPWYDVDTPAKSYRTFSSMKLNNGASLIRECAGTRSAAVTYPGSGAYFTANGHGFTAMRTVRVTGTTLPTGLSPDTSYVLYNVSTNSFSLKSTVNFGDITPSGTASGDMAMQVVPCVTQFGSVYTAGASGKWDFTQAGGSAASDPVTRIAHDKAYWMTTGLVPPYENITPSAQTAYPYEPNYMGPALPFTNSSGERPDIGVMPSWHVKHLLLQTASAEQTARMTGLAASSLPNAVFNSTTRTFIPVNGKAYTGMPVSNTDFRSTPENNSGFTPPASGIKTIGQDAADFSHKPALPYYPYLITGEPQLLDTILEIGWLTSSNEYSPLTTQDATARPGRNMKIGANNYYGLVGLCGSLRQAAWSTRDLAVAYALCPDVPPQCPAYKQYFADVFTQNYTAIADYYATYAGAYQKTTGFYTFDYEFSFIDPWMHGYYVQATALAYMMTGSSAAKTHLDMVSKWPQYVYTNLGLHYVPAFAVNNRVAAQGAFIGSDAELTFYGINATWSSSTNQMTYTKGTGANYAPANGDRVVFSEDRRNGSIPSGLAPNIPYFVVSASTSGSTTTFQLAASAGGVALSLGSTSNGQFSYHAVSAPAGSIETSIPLGPDGYTANILGAIKLAKAAGSAVSQPMIDAMESQLAASGTSFAGEPKYRFADHL